MNPSSLFFRLRKQPFVRNVAVLQAGAFIGNSFQALGGIIIARLLQPELFGIYSLALGLASLISIFLIMGRGDAAVTLLSEARARDDGNEILEVLAFVLKITLVSGVMVLLGLFFVPWIADRLYHLSSIGYYASIIVVAAIIGTTSFNFSVVGLQVFGKIKRMTWLNLSDQIIRISLALLLVYLGWGVFGGVFGHLIGAIFIFVISLLVWDSLRSHFELFPTFKAIIYKTRSVSVKKYFNFVFWVALDRNIGMLYMALPVVLLGIYVSPAEVSFFKVAFGYMNLVVSLLGPISILLNVEFPRLNIASGREYLKKNFLRVSFYSLFFSALLATAAVLVAPVAFKILYGPSFAPSVSFARDLYFYGALMGLGVGLGPIYRALKMVGASILINIIVLGIGVPIGLMAMDRWGGLGASIWVTVLFVVSHLISFIYALRRLN